jgi:hypothetical protein
MNSSEFIPYLVTIFGIIGVLLFIQTSLNKAKREISKEYNVWNNIYSKQEKAEEFEAIYVKPRNKDKTKLANLNHKKFLRIKNSSLVQSINQKAQESSLRSRMVKQEK